MQKKTVAILFPSEPNFNEFAFKYFILSLNKLQTPYEFIFPETHPYVLTNDYYKTSELFALFKSTIKPMLKLESNPHYFVNIIKPNMGSNLFFECDGNVTFITTDTWDRLFSPPSLFEYLFHCIVASLLFMHPKIDLGSHTETRGCYFDYTFYKTDDKVDIVLGYICQDCRSRILKIVDKNFLNQIDYIITRTWLGTTSKEDTVAHNLKKYFKIDIEKDSGFNKTTWEKIRDTFYDLPKQAINTIVSALIGFLIGKSR